jgi:hypothetical protein
MVPRRMRSMLRPPVRTSPQRSEPHGFKPRFIVTDENVLGVIGLPVIRCGAILRLRHRLIGEQANPASRSTSDSRILSGLVSSLSLRMPRCADTAEASLLNWQALLDRISLSGNQTLLIAPLDQPWIDNLSGSISTAGLFCIRASLESRRLSTEKSDSFPPAFITLADRFVKETRAAGSPDSAASAKPEPPSPSSAKLVSLIIVTLLLLGGVGGILVKRLLRPDPVPVSQVSRDASSQPADSAVLAPACRTGQRR